MLNKYADKHYSEEALLLKRKRAQEEIFTTFDWWDKSCFLYQMSGDRCDYIESCITRVFGKGALAQQEILEVGSGGGLLCEQLAQRQAIAIGIEPAAGALETARTHARQSGLGQNIYYQQGYAESLPYADSSFSAIVCLDVLEHGGVRRSKVVEPCFGKADADAPYDLLERVAEQDPEVRAFIPGRARERWFAAT